MADRRWLGGILVCCFGVVPPVAAADTAPDPSAGGIIRDALQVSQARLHELLARTLSVVGRDRPLWLVGQSQGSPESGAPPGDAAAQLVLQDDRHDGADLLTLRYPLASRGALRTYAGAGLNRADHIGDADGAPLMLTRRNRQQSLGAAAELGAELQLSGQLMVNADLRWADLHDDAVLLRSADGYVDADAVSMGISIGWRFR